MLFAVDYTCAYDREEVNATSGGAVLGGSLQCGFVTNVLGIYGDNEVGSTDCKSSLWPITFMFTFTIVYLPFTSNADCHSSCKSCLRGNDSTACTSCNDDSHVVAGDPAGPCQPPGKNGASCEQSRVDKRLLFPGIYLLYSWDNINYASTSMYSHAPYTVSKICVFTYNVSTLLQRGL